MSFVGTVKTTVDDLGALRAGIERLGFEWREGQRAARTHEGHVRCEHAIAVPGARYEIGVVAAGDGRYSLSYDSYSVGGLTADRIGADASRIIQHYGVERAKREALSLGIPLLGETTLADGTIELLTGRWTVKMVKMTFGTDGKVRVEALGFTGDGCRAAVAPFERALGTTVGEELKPEYHEQPTAVDQDV